MELDKRDLDRHITGNYGEDQFRDYVEIHPEIKARINAVSQAWNDLIYTSGRDEIERRKIGDTFYHNPIVTALNPDGSMVRLSDALQKLFELAW